MVRAIFFAALSAIAVFAIDQYIKLQFLEGFEWRGDFFSLYLVLNRGVAFSMFAFLGESLKYIQIALIVVLGVIAYREKEFFMRHFVAVGILLGAGLGNIIDRFLHGGVVDYIAWHYGFDFAVFNFADVMINVAVFLIVLRIFLEWRAKKAA